MAGKLRLGGVVDVQDIDTGGKIRGEEMLRAVGKEVAKFPRDSANPPRHTTQATAIPPRWFWIRIEIHPPRNPPS